MATNCTGSASEFEQIPDLPEEKRLGRLKIFFGYAAGVGKTCAMLSAAHEEQKAGIDVAAGCIESHHRPETLILLKGLELMPPLEVTHNGILTEEFDLDRAIRRRPDLILLDDLAHINAAGSRHKKDIRT